VFSVGTLAFLVFLVLMFYSWFGPFVILFGIGEPRTRVTRSWLWFRDLVSVCACVLVCVCVCACVVNCRRWARPVCVFCFSWGECSSCAVLFDIFCFVNERFCPNENAPCFLFWRCGCLSVCLFMIVSLHAWLHVWMRVHLFVCLFACLSVSMSLCMSECRSACIWCVWVGVFV
jgi:hypothetical protein